MKYIYLAITIFLFTACEDVIDLPLQEGPKRLVIDANINVNKSDIAPFKQQIRLTQTAGFYDTTIPSANGATVIIENSSNDPFEFSEIGTSGIYEIDDFNPTINETYTLTVVYNGETFTAEETMMPVADIESTVQTAENFFGTEVIKVEHFFQDPESEEGQENFYINQFNYPTFLIDSYGARSDDFSDGQLNSIFEQSDDFEPGEVLTLYFYGASKQYFNYFNLLQNQIQSGGPFGTPPAAVKGNCINTTNPDLKPLGYFRLSQMVKIPYTIEPIE
tara:strand:- start:3106 stop:3933 length:828 start_codon:yes stop_codon:yes gene_type:complete